MVDAFTKRNHYNPCFWTALWNIRYFESLVCNDGNTLVPRDQDVYALNIRSKKVYQTKVEKVHYDKNLGLSEITPDAMKRFCKRWFPAEYENIVQYVEEDPSTLYMDFEEILAGIEDKGGYNCLMEAARVCGISNPEHKGILTCVLIIHAMRSHEMMASMLGLANSLGMEKFEYFWLLKNSWGNPLVLARPATPLAKAQWILYRTLEHRFPLCDSPVMIHRDTVMAVLSPRLIVEINLNVEKPEDCWIIRDGISTSKYREFRRRSIANSFTEIIFHDREELERWRLLPEFKERSVALGEPDRERILLNEAASRVLWAIRGFGRVPPNFESLVKQRFDA